MKTLLVLAPHPETAEALRAGLSPEQYRIVHRVGVDEAEPLLAHGIAQACIMDVELTGVQEIWILEKLRRRAPACQARARVRNFSPALHRPLIRARYGRG